jgi:hypothetical protein
VKRQAFLKELEQAGEDGGDESTEDRVRSFGFEEGGYP